MIAYTTIGGVQAVAWTDVKQMFIVVFGMSAAVVILLYGILQHVSFGAGAASWPARPDVCKAVDFSFNLSETYTFWSAMLGGTFLMLSYFGCDQSQVQRYLTAKSIDEARSSLMMSAWVKIPLQLLILTTGVLVFVFYLFNTPPMLFNRVYDEQVAAGPRGAEYAGAAAGLRRRRSSPAARRRCASTVTRSSPATRGSRTSDPRPPASSRPATGDAGYSDVNYVFPTFITTRMPIGLVGLMIAAIFAAAMSASGGELNALATATVIDFYRRHFVKDGSDTHYVFVSKLATFAWGLFACFVAMRAANQGSLIEVVNRYGSVVYGSLLGVFILAILTKRATSRGAFWGTIAGMAAVLYVYNWMPWIAFLWHNLIGAVVVVSVGMAISYMQRPDAIRVES